MKVENQIGLGESISLRTYYALSTITDATQTVVKVTATIFASFLSASFLSRSKSLNAWSAAHISDLTVTAKMTWLAAKGVVDPVTSTDLRDALDIQGVHGLGRFEYKVVDKMNLFEKFTIRFEFVINLVKEIFDVAISGIRYGMACVIHKINPGSKLIDRVAFHEFLTLSSHTAYLLASCEGVIRPTAVSYKMINA